MNILKRLLNYKKTFVNSQYYNTNLRLIELKLHYPEALIKITGFGGFTIKILDQFSLV